MKPQKHFVQNPPTKHHYIPAFYTKRWTASDGRLVVYSRPYQQVIDRRLFPDGTGYLESLYTLRDFEPELSNQIEERFFKPVDFQASEALREMERYGDRVRWHTENRTAWTRFILSLLMRCPEDLDLLREYWATEKMASDPGSEERYARIRNADDPPTFRDYLLSRPEFEHEKILFDMYQKLIDNENIGVYINQMHWSVIDTSDSNLALMTSDRPLVRTNGLKAENGHLALPIGPYRLFVAAHEGQYLQDIRRTPVRDIVMQCNRTVLSHAVRFGYAHDLSQRKFAHGIFATEHEPRLMESTIARQRERRSSI